MKNRKIVSDGRILSALARAGHIEKPRESMQPKGKKWGSGFCYVEPGGKNHFRHNGAEYWIAYRDGCFLPFVFTLTA